MTLPAFAAERVRRVYQPSIYLHQAPALSSKPAARCWCCRSTGQTDGRTDDDRYIAYVHTMRAAPIITGAQREAVCQYNPRPTCHLLAHEAHIMYYSRDPTFAPQTPAPSPENNRQVHLSLVCPTARISCRGMCPEKGQMSSTGADNGRPYRACAMLDSHGLQPLVDRGRSALAAAAGLLPAGCRA